MFQRIVLSLFLVVLAVGCDAKLSATADDDPLGKKESALTVPLPCGVWIGTSEGDADQKSLSGAAPDLLVNTTTNTTCYDAISIANQKWPGHSVVRYAKQRWIAVGVCEAPGVPQDNGIGTSPSDPHDPNSAGF